MFRATPGVLQGWGVWNYERGKEAHGETAGPLTHGTRGPGRQRPAWATLGAPSTEMQRPTQFSVQVPIKQGGEEEEGDCTGVGWAGGSVALGGAVGHPHVEMNDSIEFTCGQVVCNVELQQDLRSIQVLEVVQLGGDGQPGGRVSGAHKEESRNSPSAPLDLVGHVQHWNGHDFRGGG